MAFPVTPTEAARASAARAQNLQALLTEKIFPAELTHPLREFYASQSRHLIIHKKNVIARLVLRNITALWDNNILGI